MILSSFFVSRIYFKNSINIIWNILSAISLSFGYLLMCAIRRGWAESGKVKWLTIFALPLPLSSMTFPPFLLLLLPANSNFETCPLLLSLLIPKPFSMSPCTNTNPFPNTYHPTQNPRLRRKVITSGSTPEAPGPNNSRVDPTMPGTLLL